MDDGRAEAMAEELFEAAKLGRQSVEDFSIKYSLDPATVIAILKMVCAIGQPLFDTACPIINDM